MSTASFLQILHIDGNFVALRRDRLIRLLHEAAAMGYNAILWELENKVRFETLGDAVDPEAMSPADFRAVLAESRALGLEPIPLLQTIGHGEYVLRHAGRAGWRENPARHDCYCTTHPEVRAFFHRLIGEYLDLFGELRFFHLGGDEAYEFASCPRCAGRAAAIGHNALYAEHIAAVSAPLTARGIRPGVWADMILARPEKMDAIPRSWVIWDWNYSGTSDRDETVRIWGRSGGMIRRDRLTPELLERFPSLPGRDGRLNGFYTADFLAAHGYEVVLCSTARAAGDFLYCGQYRRHCANVAGVARKARTAGLLGMGVTSWGVRLFGYDVQLPVLSLGPLAAARPEADPELLLRENAGRWFGAAGDEVNAALLPVATLYPFAIVQDLGIQWNLLKDQLPAPAGWFASHLAELRRNNHPVWGRRRELLDRAEREQATALALLAGAAARADRGGELLLTLLRALSGNLAHVRLCRFAVDAADGAPVDRAAARRLADALRRDFEAYLALEQQPDSARINAARCFDAITEFLN